jgi:hypothetical protein
VAVAVLRASHGLVVRPSAIAVAFVVKLAFARNAFDSALSGRNGSFAFFAFEGISENFFRHHESSCFLARAICTPRTFAPVVPFFALVTGI